jgi:FkbM family methyltransferase
MFLWTRIKSYLLLHIKVVLKSLTGRSVFKSYSQFGEDAYLYAYFKGQTWQDGKPMYLPADGFYVDVGAYSPTECSNTYAFYRQGWHGINIDATPGVMDSFSLLRRRDINLNMAIGAESGELTFYSWGVPNVFNTANPEIARQRAASLGQQPVEMKVKCMPLAGVLEMYIPPGKTINFLTVDVEGLDLEVLRSNDWSKYRPELVVAEEYSYSIEMLRGSELIKYMDGLDYELLAWLKPSIIFRKLS